MHEKSLFIVVEGLDGSGKTSVSRRLVDLLNSNDEDKVKLTFEPHDSSCAGLFIRQILMKKISRFSPRALALAFAANRLDHCEREISPWLDAEGGNVVICDRYYLSSIVYQSSDDFPATDVLRLNEKARKPDMIFFLNVSDEICYERMKIRDEEAELFEQNLAETRQKYHEAITFLRKFNSDTIIEIDASGEIDQVANEMLEEIHKAYPEFLPHESLVLESGMIEEPGSRYLNGQDQFTLEHAAKELSTVLELSELHDEQDLIRKIEKEVGSWHFRRLSKLFLDYLKFKGISVKKKLPWAEVDAFELEYTMPGGILLRGIGLAIHEEQRYDLIMKKAADTPEMSDFMFVFSPGPSKLVTPYYEREKIVFNTETRKEGLFPSTKLVTQRDIATAILRIRKVVEKANRF